MVASLSTLDNNASTLPHLKIGFIKAWGRGCLRPLLWTGEPSTGGVREGMSRTISGFPSDIKSRESTESHDVEWRAPSTGEQTPEMSSATWRGRVPTEAQEGGSNIEPGPGDAIGGVPD